MSHTYKFGKTTFISNSDGSGTVEIISHTLDKTEVPFDDLAAYIDEIRGYTVTGLNVVKYVSCPACDGEMNLEKIKLAAKSRFAPGYICGDCGAKEAQEGFFWKARFRASHNLNIK